MAVDTRDKSHADYLYDAAADLLYVVSVGAASGTLTCPNAGTTDDLRVYRLHYDTGTSTFVGDPGFPVTIGDCGPATATIARDSTGKLWVTYPQGTDVMVTHSTTDDLTWAVPFVLPTQAEPLDPNRPDISAIIAFGGDTVGIMWSNHATSPTAMRFSVHNDGDPETTWQPAETAVGDGEMADNHINLKTDSAGRVYAVTKTGKDTTNPNPAAQAQPLILLLRRSAAGVWDANPHIVSRVRDLHTRPQLVIDEELGAVYVFMAAPNGGGTVYLKSAPLSGPGALTFAEGMGTPFIRSATDVNIDDVTTMKQNVDASTDILVEASDRVTKWYLHGFLGLAASDAAPPAPVPPAPEVNAGATATNITTVSVDVTATDPGSGVSQVRLANSSAMSGDQLTSGTTYAYTTPVSWTLTPATPDGLRTVYVQWRDSVGNWSTVSSDAITLDTTPPSGTVSVNGGASATNDPSVSVAVPSADGDVANVRLSNTAATSAGVLTDGTTFAYATPQAWTLAAGADGTRTVYVQWQDTVGNWSGVSSDAIALDTTPADGTVSIDAGAAYTTDTGVSVAVSSGDADVASVRLSNTPDTTDGLLTDGTTFAYATPQAWTLAAGADGERTVYVQWRDATGNWSAVSSDAITLDTAAPSGAVSINGGAPLTSSTGVSVAVPATDAGSGVANVRLSNTATTAAGLLTDGTTFAYATPQAWTLAAGADGTRTVYVQWQDGAGNWSGVSSDAITLDTVAPSGTVAINGGVAWTTSRSVTLSVPASDATGTVTRVRIKNSNDFATAVERPYAPTQPWTLLSGADGTRTVYVWWKDDTNHWSPVATSDSIILDTVPPNGSVLVNGGAAWTNRRAVSVAVSATDARSGVTSVRLSNTATTSGGLLTDGTNFTYATPRAWTLAAGADGVRTVYVQWRDGAGNWSAAKSDTITLDTGLPTAVAPTQRLLRLAQLGLTTVPVRLAWSGSDSLSGIASYQLQQSTDGSAYAAVPLPTPARTWLDRSLAPGHWYRFRVRDFDRAGNVSAWAYGTGFRLPLYQESSSAIHYTGVWHPQSAASASGGALTYTTAAGAEASFTSSGRTIAWVSPIGPTRGKVKVYIDGVYAGTVDLYSATAIPRTIVFVRAWTDVGTHTIVLRNVGTAGRPRADLDAFVLFR